MSGGRNRVQGGNVETQASAVPQGDGQRRARPESEGVTGQPAATRRRAKKARRPEWTMSSTVRDILLEGSTGMANMKLNDFLRNYVGGGAAVDEDHNVTMEVFVQEPDDYVQDQQLFDEIHNLTEYQVLEGRRVLLEATTKLEGEGVFILEEWRDFGRKDTVTLLAREKLDEVLTQVLKEKMLEAKGRAWQQRELEFTISTNIEDVLFKGSPCFMEIKLNDFLALELYGWGILRANRNVLLKEFFKEPSKYIYDAGVLGAIQASFYYARMDIAVWNEMIFDEDIRKLHENGVRKLFEWSEAAADVKESVERITKQFLDAAVIESMSPMTKSAPMKLEGCYESVYNSRWHHVVEVPDGEGMGMEVKEGKPEQSWTYKKVGYTLERNVGAEEPDALRLRLMVLTSDKGWPYSWKEEDSIRDCYVNCEVERVWNIVKRDLTEFFGTHSGTYFTTDRSVFIGTPGMGKSMNAGSYLLYQLLHHDAEQLPMVAYFIGNRTFLFDKIAKTVSVYMGEGSILRIVDGLSRRGVKGYIIYDVALKGHQPSTGLPCKGWGMIVVTSPNRNDYEWWAKQMRAEEFVINCPEENDVRAMCAWMKRNQIPQEQAEYWEEVRGRMNNVGPILRFIFDKQAYDDRIKACQQAVDGMNASKSRNYLDIGYCCSSNDSDLSQKLVKVVRVRRGYNFELPLTVLISPHLERETLSRLENEMEQSDFIFLLLMFWDYVPPYLIEKYAVSAFLNEDFLRAIRLKIEEMRPPGRREPHSCALVKYSYKSFARKEVLPPPERLSNPVAMDHWVLYEPKVQNFPLVDGFFFVDSNPMTLVGLRMTTAGEHHTTASTVRQFTECLAAYFNGWEGLSQDMSWEIIYVQQADSTPMNGWQRCDVVNSNNLSDDENRGIAAFWEEKVRQYLAAVSSADARRGEAL
ncbi:putative retrotransposon hot spot protein (RHS) [Trypanosoma cruzi]|uniref:Retrotransposon hot spot (RHS) protein, putative n=2 Tax=Trypanosoma cruzi TaxID=5693 RepID=Q4DZ47_TRYCC|nr:retrotransposon hot spot (RHS) protein, putative [Trypanosoma cruzi]EAN97802.1 retrotransposon hot spot (RHS) protein, putative [Trypanosoma cruzi]PWV05398.1 putative retrotransposon hot spot protein (RHS) [Trypanosoma cruzi]RNC34866.1 putative retrotransposon hot spot (RHS) protein [Trypanosoma cruzi]|eukprot:XP_819653.1 retrotransposon hot spot (RHS) protein [Trypanosoma cruzi strain CL Brener]